MPDPFAGTDGGLESPAIHAFAITPNDDADLAIFPRAIYVGGYGDVKVDTVGGDTVEFRNFPDGTMLPVRVKRVYATTTGTAATLLIGLY